MSIEYSISMKTPRYRLVTDAANSHRGIPLPERVEFGSSTPYRAAVIRVATYEHDDDTKFKRWKVERTSFTLLAAQTFCDTLRGKGMTAIVIPMARVSIDQ